MITRDRHYRAFDFEIREAKEGDDRLMVYGKPVVFNEETVIWECDGIQYKEVIDPRAFDKCAMSDVILNIDHSGKPGAKTTNNTLRLFIKVDGLYMEADLSKNMTGRELYEDIMNGFYDKMSFSFRVADDGSEYDKATRTRRITNIKRLYDVSVVSFAAYEQTSVVARSWAEARHEIGAEVPNGGSEDLGETEVSKVELERLRFKVLDKISEVY